MPQKLFIAAVALLFIVLVAHRVWRDSLSRQPVMPTPLVASQERELHLNPGGVYTQSDIVRNGRTVPSEKYRGFAAQHDFNPQSGDAICPITRTKANPSCRWSIAGRDYQFCCPPCIDEFVRLAKETPDQIRPPDSYVK